jgi:hypothetical protein
MAGEVSDTAKPNRQIDDCEYGLESGLEQDPHRIFYFISRIRKVDFDFPPELV